MSSSSSSLLLFADLMLLIDEISVWIDVPLTADNFHVSSVHFIPISNSRKNGVEKVGPL